MVLASRSERATIKKVSSPERVPTTFFHCKASKTSQVELIELRIARGMSGKAYMMLTGDVAAVTAAIEKAKAAVGENGAYLDSSVIPSPDKRLWQNIL